MASSDLFDSVRLVQLRKEVEADVNKMGTWFSSSTIAIALERAHSIRCVHGVFLSCCLINFAVSCRLLL